MHICHLTNAINGGAGGGGGGGGGVTINNAFYNDNLRLSVYADDVVILSKSAMGLNRALNVLHVFCQKRS